MRHAIKFFVFLNFTGTLLLLQRGITEALDNVSGSNECVEYEKVGCFYDSLDNPRPLPTLIENYRGVFDWTDPQGTINSEVLQCARKVSQRGFTIFGLQFFGECWSGENSVKTYDRDGPYDRCLMVVNNMEYKQCNDSSVNLCIGVENSNYVYKIIQAVDGQFSAWSDWSLCSASCGGGQQRRTRSCSNPAPSNCGKTCIGVNEEVVVCNTQSCPAPASCEDTHADCKDFQQIGACTEKYPDVLKHCKKSCGLCP